MKLRTVKWRDLFFSYAEDRTAFQPETESLMTPWMT